MSLVEFSLSPISEIEPWGKQGDLSLSWFGFSLGRYRIKVGQDYLLNYSPEAVLRMAQNYPQIYPGPWVDYQVVRLWEDLILLVPHVLVPVPAELAPLMRLDEGMWRQWIADAFDQSEAGVVQEDDVETLTVWRNARFLRTGYLDPSANIWFWSANGKVEARWDNGDKCFEGVPAWSAQRGAYHMSSAEFLAGVQAFNDEFLAAMEERVKEICASWHRPDVRVEFEHLMFEQVDRSRWLAEELSKGGTEDTDAVRAAARALLAAVPLPE